MVKKENQNSDYYDRFRDRIIFPIADANSRIVGFSARVAPGGDETQAKYVNTPETEVYHKSKVLYGIDKAKGEIRKGNFAFLVEGNMDVIAASQAGIKNAVAVSGTALTLDQIGIIKRYADTIAMSFDMDSAGEMATQKSVRLCFEKDVKVKIVVLNEGKDAAELAQKNPEKLKQALVRATSATEYFFKKTFSRHNKNTAEGKRRIADELLDMIGRLANAVEQQHWIKKLSEALETSEASLTEMLKKATIRERITQAPNVSDSSDTFFSEKKIDILIRDLAGLMLVSGAVWKEIFARKEKIADALEDEIVNFLLQKGPETNYDFGKLIKIIPEPEMVSKLERIYFEHKYQLGLNNNLEEIIISDPLEEMEKKLKAIEQEIKKEKLQKITHDLKQAEEAGDKNAIIFLRNQFKDISETLLG